MKQYNICLN